MAEFPFWAAIRSVREGVSANAGLAAYRAGGGAIRRDTWLRMVSEAKDAVQSRGAELGRPLDRRPVAGEFTTWTTTRARGIIQQVEVLVRDKATGELLTVPYSVRTTGRTMTRADAIDLALGHIESGKPNYGDQVVLGAVYVGTLRMAPVVG